METYSYFMCREFCLWLWYDLAVNVSVKSGYLLAWDNSYTCSYSSIEHKVSGNAILRYIRENKIVVAKENEIIKY